LYKAIQGALSGMEQAQQKILRHRHGTALQTHKHINGTIPIRYAHTVISAGHFGIMGSREAIPQPTHISAWTYGNQSKVYHHTLPTTPPAKDWDSHGIESLKRGIML
jgi:hypothetical protein